MDKYQSRPRSAKHVTLPPEDEEMVRNLRSAGRRARRKIEDLEDEVTSRDRAFASEAVLRRSVDDRVSARVVDMYNNEEVNSELQSRLPRSSDRFNDRLSRSNDRSGDRFSYRPTSLSPERLAVPNERGGLLLSPNMTGAPLMLSPNVTGAPIVLSPVSLPFGDSAASRRTADRDESRQISTLINELEAVREDNRRLQAQLAEARREADEASAAALTSKAEVDGLVAAQVADAIQEIRSAQKSRDEAMMARVRVANEERDAAIERTQRYDESPEESPSPTPSYDSFEIPVRSTTPARPSPTPSYDSFEIPVRSAAPAREKPIDAQYSRSSYQKPSGRDEDNSLATLRAERDEAVQKYHQLLQEFNSEQKKGIVSENTDFGQAIAERDDALRKLRTMEDEMQTLRVYYSLHKSLSPEMIANQIGTQSIEQLRTDLQAALCREEAVNAELERTREALDAALSDRDRAETDLAKSKRLVNVLRRKLNPSDPM